MGNFIWLTENEKENIITQGKIVVTDNKGFKELLEELRNVDSYIPSGCDLLGGWTKEYLEYTSYGAIRYKSYIESTYYNSSHHRYYYSNPRAETYKLITGEFKPDKNLLDLFATLEYGNNREKQLREFRCAETILSQLNTSSLDKQTLATIIKQLWPNFGFYAIECLKFTDVEVGLKSYDITEINSIVESSRRAGVEISNEIKEILANQELARSNSGVLSLARKAHNLSNVSK